MHVLATPKAMRTETYNCIKATRGVERSGKQKIFNFTIYVVMKFLLLNLLQVCRWLIT